MTDPETEIQSVRDIIRAFLDLPATLLPGAQFIDDADGDDAWSAIREYMGDASGFDGQEIRLWADAAEWRESVYISLVNP